MHGEELCNYWIWMYWFMTINVLGGLSRIGPLSGQEHLTGGTMEQVCGFHLFLVWCWCFKMIYLWMIYYWILDERWDDNKMFDWILDECWNDYEILIEFLMNVKRWWKC